MYIGHVMSPKTLLQCTWRHQLLVLAIALVVTATYLRYLSPQLRTPASVVSIIGISLSFFIGFLNSHAYERWMQARQAFGGMKTSSRELARMVLTFISARDTGRGDQEIRALKKRLVLRQLAATHALKARMRGEGPESYQKYLDDEDLAEIEGKSHVPIAILLLQARTLEHAVDSGYLDNYCMIAINGTLNDMTAAIGTCDRINDTPFFPFYLTVVGYSLGAFLILFPMAIADAVGYWAILYTFTLGLILSLLLESGFSLMRPFDRTPSAVPLAQLTRSIEIDLLQQLGEEEVPPPVPPVGGVLP